MVTKKKPAVKSSSKPEKKQRRMLIVDEVVDPITTAIHAGIADRIEREKALTFPCADCGAETNPSNRSILQDGRTIHIGCPKAKPKDVKVPRVLAGLPKQKGVKVPEAPAPVVSKFGDIAVMCDFQGRTCIQVKRDISTVTYVPMDVSGFHLTYMPVQKFDERYKLLEKYPVEKACAHYARYAVDYGATQDVLDYLGRVVTITEEQATMAKAKLAAKSTGAAESGAPSTAKKSKAAGGEKKESASGLFKTLILEGKLTDEQIFSKVQEKFGLDDKKRGYVAWYRNHLKKSGLNPPEPKGGVKEKTETKPAVKKADKKPAAKKK